MKKLLFILSVVLALSSCSQKTLTSYSGNVELGGTYLGSTRLMPMPGEFEPMISSSGSTVPSLTLSSDMSIPTIQGGKMIYAINLPERYSGTQCYVDLQAVSIDPGTPWLTQKKKTYVQADMKNNGPAVIPAGQATCQVTINNRFLAFPYKHNFGSAHWDLVKINRKIKGQVNLFFRNKRELWVNEIAPFRFDITGKAVGIADITLASSLSGTASCSDLDGNNQSVRTEVIITK